MSTTNPDSAKAEARLIIVAIGDTYSSSSIASWQINGGDRSDPSNLFELIDGFFTYEHSPMTKEYVFLALIQACGRETLSEWWCNSGTCYGFDLAAVCTTALRGKILQ